MNTNDINKIENLEHITIAKNVQIKVGDEIRTIDIARNKEGNLEFLNLGSVIYELYEEELILSTVESDS